MQAREAERWVASNEKGVLLCTRGRVQGIKPEVWVGNVVQSGVQMPAS